MLQLPDALPQDLYFREGKSQKGSLAQGQLQEVKPQRGLAAPASSSLSVSIAPVSLSQLHTLSFALSSPQVPTSPAVQQAALGASPPRCPCRCRSPAGSSKPSQVGRLPPRPLPSPRSRTDCVRQGQDLERVENGVGGWGDGGGWGGSLVTLCSHGNPKGLLGGPCLFLVMGPPPSEGADACLLFSVWEVHA